ncbi:hypothetical protein AGMMS49944_21100 [Spirochaetia bacterium]|nr:hypothetical protein AGMMS49944_21100 [Spirochaetia bacterium]
MLKLVFLTEEQNKELTGRHKVYTREEQNEILPLARNLEDLINAMMVVCLDGQNDFDENNFLSMFTVMELLLDPITKFLSDNHGNYKETAGGEK